MIVYRISSKNYSRDLSGNGAKLFGARWNSEGNPMLYTSAHISLSLLEMLVHAQFKDFHVELELMFIQIPDQPEVKEIKNSRLKKNWIDDHGYTQFIGDEFIQSKEALLLKVPSAVVQDENNYLVNPLHPDHKKIKIIKTKTFMPDKRLFSL